MWGFLFGLMGLEHLPKGQGEAVLWPHEYHAEITHTPRLFCYYERMEHTVIVQRIEAAFLFIVSTLLYIYLDYSLLLFVPVLFLIDVSMVGYLFSKSVGAYIYNVGHSFIVPSILLGIGIPATNNLLIGLGLIWLSHIGMDRALGYGLKRRTAFTDTHLGQIGKK